MGLILPRGVVFVCVCVGGGGVPLQFLQVKIYLLQYNLQCSVIKEQKCWRC